MRLRIIGVLLAMLVCISAASAWQIHGCQYQGSVTFNADGTGVIAVYGYPNLGFNWVQVSGNEFVATGYGHSVNFVYNPVKEDITLPGYDGVYLSKN